MSEQFVEELVDEMGLTRGDLIKRTAGLGAAVTLGAGILATEAKSRPGALDKVRWISPRGTLEVMDDYNLVVPQKLGYFKALNLDVQLIAGPFEATATTKFVAGKQADLGYPSPGVLTFSIDNGIPVIMAWEMFNGQVFGFAFPEKTDITNVKQLAGKTIALGSAGWSVIVDPMLVEIGVDPSSVKYVEFGPQWTQAAALGQADAALVWWGLRAQLLGQAGGFGTGIALKFIMGNAWGSKQPSNGYASRKSDLADAKKRDILTRFFAGTVMGLEFGKANPRAASQITYAAYPALQRLISPQVALTSMMELASGYGERKRKGFGWGSADVNAWAGYLNTIFKLGQTKKQLKVSDVLTNALVKPANAKANVTKARADAKAYKVDQYFKATQLPKGLPL